MFGQCKTRFEKIAKCGICTFGRDSNVGAINKHKLYFGVTLFVKKKRYAMILADVSNGYELNLKLSDLNVLCFDSCWKRRFLAEIFGGRNLCNKNWKFVRTRPRK